MPYNYAPYYAQFPQMPPYMQQQQEAMLWVMGENDASAYPVANGASVVLWDKNRPTIYVKSANAQGVPSMRILDFTERTATTEHTCTCGDKFAKKEDVESVKTKIDILTKEFDELKTKIGGACNESAV